MGDTWMTIKHSAAKEFGERHYKAVMFMHFFRPVFLLLMMGVVVAGLGFVSVEYVWPFLISGSAYVLPSLIVSGITTVSGIVAWRAWAEWGWLFRIKGFGVGLYTLFVSVFVIMFSALVGMFYL